jgi:Cobalamin biosynthesis protein CbiG
MAKTAVYILTQQGAMTAQRLASQMDVDLYIPPALRTICPLAHATHFDSLRLLMGRTFSAYRQHVFIAAAGVAVRCIAPYLKDKSIDPAVVAMDQHGKNVVSVLSGHLGGANALAREVAALTGGQAVITTATDTENLPSLDLLALEFNLVIANFKAVAGVNAALVKGRPVVVDDPENYLQLKDSAWKDLFVFTQTPAYTTLTPEEATALTTVTVTPSLVPLSDNNLVLHPKVLHVGVDCRRGIKAHEIIDLIENALGQLEFSSGSIAGIASADAKQYESGLLDAAASLDTPLRVFSIKELDAVPVADSSPNNTTVFGVESVCEPAALLAAGENAQLLLPKLAAQGVSIAVALETVHNASG